jgi:hypothetical protein
VDPFLRGLGSGWGELFEVLGFCRAGAEHTGFLTKLKEKLHIGNKHKEEKVAAPVESKGASDDQVAAPLAPLEVPTASAGVAPEEHHGGTPTFLAALPDQDIPAEDSPTHPELHHGAPPVESEEVVRHHGVVPDGGVPTFLAALPDQDLPAEDSPTHPELHHGEFGSEQQGEHRDIVPEGGVPTFLAALPDQDIPAEVTKGVESTPNSDDSVPQESL